MPVLPELTSLHASSIIYKKPIDLPTFIAYEPIIIRAPPKTDLWRQPPDIDNHNAPTRLIHIPINIHKFRSARVTVTVGANWDTRYDQAGLVLFKFTPGVDHPVPWLKTGIEIFDEPLAMSVATSRSSDSAKVPSVKDGQVTIQLERQLKDGKKNESLWVNIVDKETGRTKEVRQVTCWFANDIPSPNEKISKETLDNRYLLIGVYAARPLIPEGPGRENEELVARLEGLEVKLFDD